MRQLVAHWMTHSLDELRVLGPLATGAFVAGGTFNSLAVTVVWLVQHHVKRGHRS
jgi:hypothetical protein